MPGAVLRPVKVVAGTCGRVVEGAVADRGIFVDEGHYLQNQLSQVDSALP